MESEKVKEIKKALEERTQHKPINCNYSEYVEACGMYCRHRREYMGAKNGQTCKNCSDFIATGEVKEYADILTLISELETENEKLMKLQAIRGEYGRMSDNEIEDRHEIASIINGCLRDGYCTASQLARRITQAGYGNVKQAVKEFAENLKRKSDFFINEDNYNEHIEVVKIKYIDELLKEYGLEVEE